MLKTQNLFVYAADICVILILLSHAGTGFCGAAAAAPCPKPVPARLRRIKIAEISSETVSYEVARMIHRLRSSANCLIKRHLIRHLIGHLIRHFHNY